MKPNEVMRALADTYPDGQRALSRKLGRSPGWFSSTLTRGSVPRLDTVAAVADACGYEVVVREKGGGPVLGTVEPPHEEPQEA